jgi:hypothetical protein
MLKRVGLPGARASASTSCRADRSSAWRSRRSLVLEPTLLLLDEPLGALDLKLREHMKIELKQLQADFGTTFVYITHDQSEALVLSDRVAVMNAGRFEQVGTPQELYYAPRSPFVAAFVGPTTASRGRRASATGPWWRSRRRTDWQLRVKPADGRRGGDAVDAFVPSRSARARARTRPACRRRRSRSRCGGSLLFDGASSAVLVRETRSRAQLRIALPRPGGSRTCVSARRSRSVRSGARDGFLRRTSMSGLVLASPGASRARLALLLLMAPALVWLAGLIVLPHVDLAVLSLRERVAPREYVVSLAQYRTFFEEPLYWHTFVRTAAISIVATAITLLIAFPVAWYIAKIARGHARLVLFVLCPHPVLGQRDGAHAGMDDPAARIRASCPVCWWTSGSRRNRSRCCITTRPSSWASSTRRCCSWWCRSSAPSTASTMR